MNTNNKRPRSPKSPRSPIRSPLNKNSRHLETSHSKNRIEDKIGALDFDTR